MSRLFCITLLLPAMLCLGLILPDDAAHSQTVICSGEAAGGYAAFPDVARIGDGRLMCVFYAGYRHVSTPTDTCKLGGRISAIYSSDEGKTWSAPTTLIDTPLDDRDPSICLLPNGDILCDWFTYDETRKGKEAVRTYVSRSRDGGKTWSDPKEIRPDIPNWLACSSPARILPDGSLILGLYSEDPEKARNFGSIIKSRDGGETWTDFSAIDKESNVHLDAETDVIQLKDGRLFAALRSSRVNMHKAYSSDLGKTWTPVVDIGFKGHCPYLLRHSSGVILMGVRLPGTSLYWSNDETATWKGPLQVDTRIGAYPSMVELKDGTVLFVYYEEGAGSGIRSAALKVGTNAVSMGAK